MNRRQRRILAANRALIKYERVVEGSVFRSQRRLARLIRKRWFAGAPDRVGAWIHEWRGNDLQPNLEKQLTRVALTFGDLFFNSPGIKSMGPTETKTFKDVFKRVIIEWILEHALEQSRTIARRNVSAIREILAQAQSDGLGERDTVKKLGEYIENRSHAARIARTETHTAAERASREAALSTGLDMVKEWGATEDLRTRETHAKADGQITEMDVPFIVGTSQLLHPGDPAGPAKEVINCRCTALYHPRIDGEIIK